MKKFGPSQYRALGVMIFLLALLGAIGLIDHVVKNRAADKATKEVVQTLKQAAATPTPTPVADEESDFELLSRMQTKLSRAQELLNTVSLATDVHDNKTFCTLMPQLVKANDDFNEVMIKANARPGLAETTKKIAPNLVEMQRGIDIMDENTAILC